VYRTLIVLAASPIPRRIQSSELVDTLRIRINRRASSTIGSRIGWEGQMARRTSGSNPTQGKFGSRTKDKVELLLWRKVCVDKTMTLDQTKTALSEALDEASSAEMKKRLAFSPKVRFGLNASCRAHALPPELFQATLPAFLRHAHLRIVAFGRARTPRRNRHT